MADENKNYKFALLAIVAIVAIVACVVLIQDGKERETSFTSDSELQQALQTFEENSVGQVPYAYALQNYVNYCMAWAKRLETDEANAIAQGIEVHEEHAWQAYSQRCGWI
jgi:hypothetical protein